MGILRSGCHGNSGLTGIRLSDCDSFLTPHFPFPLTGSCRFAVFGVWMPPSQVTERRREAEVAVS